MPNPNNPPTPEFFNGSQSPSIHDSILSNTSGHLISVNVANHFPPGNFHSLVQLSSENRDLRPALGQMMEEYPTMNGPRAPGKSNNPFAPNRNDLPEVETTGTSYLIYFVQADDFDIDPPFTNSSNDSSSVSSAIWRDGPLQHQVSVSFCPYLILSCQYNDQELPNAMGSGSWSSSNSNLVSLVSLPSTPDAWG